MSEILAQFERMVRAIMRDTRYHAQYACRVEAQSGQFLDLLPDDETIRGTGLQRVPLRHGLPGVTVKVVPGSRVLLGFESGDRRKPYAALWDSASIEEISFDGGQAPIARMGDSVTIFWPPTVQVVGFLGPLAFTGTMTITSPSVGQIAAGAERVRA